MRARVLTTLLALVWAGAMGACATVPTALVPSQAPAARPRTGRGGPTLTVAVSSDFPTLDPATAQDTESISAVQLMYEPLFSYGSGGRLVGRLASSWHWNRTGTRLTVGLNPRAHFADGSPVTAGDVVFSLDRMLARATGAPRAASFSALVGFAALRAGKPHLAQGITAAGRDVVVFRLTHPLPYLPDLLALPSASIVEQSVVAKAPATPAWWFQHSAGSGPYVLGSSNPGASLVLRRAAHYWRSGRGGGAEGPFVRVEFRIISSPAQQLRQFAAGRLDVLSSVSPQRLASVALPPGSRLWQGSDLGLAYLGFDTAKPPFDNVLMRRAVAYALHKRAILAAAGGQGQVAAGMLPPGIPGYNPRLAPYPYDPARARALFRLAGGKPGLPVTLLTISAGGTVQQATTDASAALIARELDAVGFQATVQKDSWAAYYRDRAAGRGNLFQAQWLADYPDPQDFMFNLLDSAANDTSSASFWSNAAFDRAEARAARMVDATARAAAYQALDALVASRLPILPEFYTQTALLVQPAVSPQSFHVLLDPPLLPQLDRLRLLPPA